MNIPRLLTAITLFIPLAIFGKVNTKNGNFSVTYRDIDISKDGGSLKSKEPTTPNLEVWDGLAMDGEAITKPPFPSLPTVPLSLAKTALVPKLDLHRQNR